MGAIRFLWTATRGARLRPWTSPYLRWRMETYTGKKADQVCLRDYLQLMMQERAQFLRFLRWVNEMEKDAQPKH